MNCKHGVDPEARPMGCLFCRLEEAVVGVGKKTRCR